MIIGNFYLNTAIILTAAYLIGAFPSAYIAGKLKGIDVIKTGSNNVGGMNTISSVGKLPGVIVTIIDIAKGFLATYMAAVLSGKHPLIPLWAAVAVVIGHNWMAYIGFKGGKGAAAFLGSILFLSPWSFLMLYLIIIPVLLIILKDIYLSTASGFFLFSFFLWLRKGSVWWLLFGFIITLLYSIKCSSFLKTYFTCRRRDVNPILKKVLRPFLEMSD